MGKVITNLIVLVVMNIVIGMVGYYLGKSDAENIDNNVICSKAFGEEYYFIKLDKEGHHTCGNGKGEFGVI